MVPDNTFARRVARSFLYSGLGTAVSKGLSVVAIFVALKFLSSEDFGAASIVFAIFAIINSVTELGLGAALVQKKDLSRSQTDSLFWVSLAFSGLMYGLLFAGAPLLAWYYDEPTLAPLLRVYGLGIVLYALYLVPRNLMVKELKFRRIAIIDSVPLLLSSLVMIGLAIGDYGAWAFILAEIANRVLQFLFCMLFRPYIPRFHVDLKEIRDMISFGLYATGSRLLYNFYIQADYLIVGKVFGLEAAGVYTLAYRVVADPVRTLASIINQVAYPAFSALQDNIPALRTYLFNISRASLILIGLVLGLIVLYIDWLLVAIGYEKWLDAVPLIRVFGFLGLARTVSPLVPQLLNALGQAKLSFYYSLVCSIFIPLALVAGAQVSLMGVVWAWVLAYPLALIVLYRYGARLLEMSTMRFFLRLYSGLAVLLPVAAVGFAMRWAAGRFVLAESEASAGITACCMVTMLATGLALVWFFERHNLRLLMKKTSKSKD